MYLSIFTELHNDHHDLIVEHFHHTIKKVRAS